VNIRPIVFTRSATLSIGLASLTAFVAPVVRADPPHSPDVTCTGGGLRGHPKFMQAPPGRAEYHFSGVCKTRDGRAFGYLVDGTWTPSEPNPRNANASEVYHVDTLSGPSQSFVAVMGARCARDPWLNEVNCTPVGDDVPDALRTLWPDLAGSPFPNSRRGVPYDQRAALQAEYNRANGRLRLVQGANDEVHRASGGPRKADAIQRTGSGAASADDLNPQPLPPGPPDPGMTQTAASRIATKGAEAGIIIVSGQPAYQPTRKKVKSRKATLPVAESQPPAHR